MQWVQTVTHIDCEFNPDLRRMGVLCSRTCVVVLFGVIILATLCGGAFRQREDEFAKFKARMHAKQIEDNHLKSQTVSKPQKQITPSAAKEWKSKYAGTWLDNQKESTGGNMSHVSSKYALEFYNLTLVLAGPNAHFHNLGKIHLMRIPKASSSSMSAIARRAVGCSPPGPCCRYPGEPKGSCPSKEMSKCQEAKKVIGCTDHFPMIWYLFEQRVPSITMMRNPFARSLSGFFYPGIHHNSACSRSMDDCFVEYLRDPRWQNVAVKMFTGSYPYAPVVTCEGNTTCHHSLQLAVTNLPYFAFVGVAEMWELSLLVMHQKLPTLAPNLQEFLMGTEENVVTKGSRVNMKAGYGDFKQTALTKYYKELHEQNALDAALYRQVLHNLCNDLHTFRLWEHEIVRAYWAERSPYQNEQCP